MSPLTHRTATALIAAVIGASGLLTGCAPPVVGTCTLKPGTDCAGARLYQADLSGLDLTGANFRGADLEQANLVGTNLTGVDLRDAQLKDANLTDANLTGAQLDGTKLEKANLTGVQPSDVILLWTVAATLTCPNGEYWTRNLDVVPCAKTQPDPPTAPDSTVPSLNSISVQFYLNSYTKEGNRCRASGALKEAFGPAGGFTVSPPGSPHVLFTTTSKLGFLLPAPAGPNPGGTACNIGGSASLLPTSKSFSEYNGATVYTTKGVLQDELGRPIVAVPTFTPKLNIYQQGTGWAFTLG